MAGHEFADGWKTVCRRVGEIAKGKRRGKLSRNTVCRWHRGYYTSVTPLSKLRKFYKTQRSSVDYVPRDLWPAPLLLRWVVSSYIASRKTKLLGLCFNRGFVWYFLKTCHLVKWYYLLAFYVILLSFVVCRWDLNGRCCVGCFRWLLRKRRIIV